MSNKHLEEAYIYNIKPIVGQLTHQGKKPNYTMRMTPI